MKTSLSPYKNFPVSLWKLPYLPMKTSLSPYENFPISLWKFPYLPIKTSLSPYENFPLSLWKLPYLPMKTSLSPYENFPISLWKLPYLPMKSRQLWTDWTELEGFFFHKNQTGLLSLLCFHNTTVSFTRKPSWLTHIVSVNCKRFNINTLETEKTLSFI